MNGGWWQYAAVFIGASALSLVFTPLAIKFAVARSVLDEPGGHKSHSSPVPYLGGVAIVLAFSLIVGVAAVVDQSTRGDSELVKVLGIAIGLALLGLIDDLKGLPALFRLVVEIGSGVLLHVLDVGVQFTGSEFVDLTVTVLWVVGLTNAFNMIDNMDGLSAGLAAIAAASFFAIAAANGQFLVAALAAGIAGCALGFLRHNYHPARIYMGDAGAYFLGFMLSYSGLKIQFLGSPQNNTFIVPVVVCSVAIFDTSLVTITRLYHRISPLQGGRDHTSHRLVKVGLPIRVAVGLIHLAGAAVGVVAFVIARVDDTSGWILVGLTVTLMSGFGALLAMVPVYESSRHALYRVEKSEA
ncbi:MAG: glycosyltransferase family 4 protein [Actinomycetota bacterium]